MKNKYIPLSVMELATMHRAKMTELRDSGYEWDKALSISYCGVVLTKLVDKQLDIWVFDLEGGLHHNPDTVVINVK